MAKALLRYVNARRECALEQRLVIAYSIIAVAFVIAVVVAGILRRRSVARRRRMRGIKT
jgi:hypothetical protein